MHNVDKDKQILGFQLELTCLERVTEESVAIAIPNKMV